MNNEKAIKNFQGSLYKAYNNNKITELQLDNSLEFLKEVIKLGYTEFNMTNLLDLYLKAILNK